MSKRDAAVYLAAAEIVDRGLVPHCCPALVLAATDGMWHTAGSCKACARGKFFQSKFAAIFRPHNRRINTAWFGTVVSNANQNRRILALCLAAAMAEAGDL